MLYAAAAAMPPGATHAVTVCVAVPAAVTHRQNAVPSAAVSYRNAARCAAGVALASMVAGTTDHSPTHFRTASRSAAAPSLTRNTLSLVQSGRVIVAVVEIPDALPDTAPVAWLAQRPVASSALVTVA